MPTPRSVQHVEVARVVGATPEAVFDRLVNPTHLREWFCEHAEVEPRVNGAYRFWGRYTPLVPGPSAATQRITRLDWGRALRYSWPWAGTDTEVLIELTDQAGSVPPAGEVDTSAKAPAAASQVSTPLATTPRTNVWVRHSLLEGAIAGYSRQESACFLQDLWNVALGNLGQHVKTGRAALRPDFVAPGPIARVSIEIDAPPERVWLALTDPAQRDRWLSTGGACEARPGGAYTYGWTFDGQHCGPMTILEIDPPRRLVHDWFHSSEPASRTEWLLDPLPGGRTRVTISQIGIDGSRNHTGYTGGWAKFALALRDVFEPDSMLNR